MVILLVDAELERGKGKETGYFWQKKTLLKDNRRRKCFGKKMLKGKWLPFFFFETPLKRERWL